jgi:uncharacterized membrane protein
MKRSQILALVFLAGLLHLPRAAAHAQAGLPVVRAVLFYSPACGHCHLVITETLPPLVEKHGPQLEVIGIDVTQPDGQALFGAALHKFGLEQAGVPFLVIDDTFLIGSVDIPEKFPGLVEGYLGQGGVDWPQIQGLPEVIASLSQVKTGTAAASTPPSTALDPPSPPVAGSPSSLPAMETSDWRRNFSRDPAGNSLSVLTLAFMLGSVVWTIFRFRRRSAAPVKKGRKWVIPILCLVGFCVAAYLAYVEAAQIPAVCGPVGDCNTVQQSEYARVLGVLPIGMLGLIGYAAIFTAWLIARSAAGRRSQFAELALFAMAVFGTAFSVYLTFLEPFVIGATCAWCLTSALIMTALMLSSTGSAKRAYIGTRPIRSGRSITR